MLLRRLILPLCYLVFACKSVPQPSIEKIINGHMVAELPAKQQEKYKSVIPIKSPQGRICTGIVVAPKTMMTAAHCVLNVNEEVAPVSVLGVQSYKQYRHSSYSLRIDATNRAKFDLAIVFFKEDIAAKVGVNEFPNLQFSHNGPQDKVIIAGFDEVFPNAPNVFLNYANAEIKSIDNFIVDVEARVLRGKKGAAGRGDSGGPMYDTKGNIIGIASNSDYLGVMVRSRYTRVCGSTFTELYKLLAIEHQQDLADLCQDK